MSFLFVPAVPVQASSGPQITGKSAIMIDAQNGQVLYAKNPDAHMFPASTTKILTAVIALERGKLSDQVTVPREAVTAGGSAIGLQEGERLTLKDLLYAMLLSSANDAAVTIADHIAGSVPGFAALMNEKARQIGARESHFVNPDGMPDPQHFTTARDLAVITRYAMQNAEFRKIVDTSHRNISRADADRSKGPPQEYLWNHNKLLHLYDGTIGVKPGYTVEAGQCLAAAAQRNGRELITVVLDSQGAAIYSDTEALFNYGFSSFQLKQLAGRGQRITSLSVPYGAGPAPVLTAAPFYYDFPAGGQEQGQVEQKVVMEQNMQAPLAAGQKVGQLIFLAHGRELGRVDLVTGQAVNRRVETRWPVWAAGTAIVLLVLRLRVLGRRRSRVRLPRYLR
ncbi:D-alanyl-D-alanine carboxypeptidase family protein [Desulfotomaculum copahuensis]|uniref:D-alanyl-D-alanine carboxypeptidase family protein n=1 Tax=Desulfotomaculum copahuensis TaxID=1838280 RepID=UPI001372D551|nr:D-alanyl-D-alanine carboxypeptidase family protein [Desulfotomaculum copahuensis]